MPAASKPAGRPDRDEIFVITNRVEKWRFKCPNAPYHHDDWRIWNGVFCCESCRKLRDNGERSVEPVFDSLWDAKECQLVGRDRIQLEV